MAPGRAIVSDFASTPAAANIDASPCSRSEDRGVDEDRNKLENNIQKCSAKICENMVNISETDEPIINTMAESPSGSVCSNQMTIVSLDDDDVDSSSIADSDSDDDHVPSQSEFMAGALSAANGRLRDNVCADSNGIIVINNAGGGLISGGDSTRPNIGSIALQNSSDITFGDKKYFQAPVTIKKYYLEKDQWVRRDGVAVPPDGGNENFGFVHGAGDVNATGGPSRQSPTIDKKQQHIQLLLEKRPVLFALIVGAFLLLSGIVVASTYLFVHTDYIEGASNILGDGDDYRHNIPIDSSIGDDLLPGNAESLRFISRSQWLAQPPNNELAKLVLPSQRLIVAHTATENCSNQAQCVFRVRFIQTFHIESLQFDDIGYNFLVGGDGAAYEGRGWDTEGAHTKGFNKRSICIAFIGTFTKVAPPKRQLKAAMMLIQQGLDLHKLAPDYKLYGHRQLMGTESPGIVLYDTITMWPHWENQSIS